MPTKQEILDWLKKIGKPRSFLAQRCGVRPAQVYNWFSKNGVIPKAKLKLIKLLMEETSERKEPPYELPNKDELGRMFVTLNDEAQQIVFEEANRLNITVDAYCTLLIEWCATTEEGKAAAEVVIQQHVSKTKKSVEDPAPIIEKISNMAANIEGYNLSVIGNIAAGGLQPGDTIPYHIKANRPLGNGEYVLRVEGKSMEPDIKDGALVVMRKHTIPPIPKIGTIVQYDDERGVTLKKMVRRKNPETGKLEYTLHPLNPAFGEIEPMDGGKISGVFVETLSNWVKA